MFEKKYLRTIDGNFVEDNESGLRIYDLLKLGDLVKIEFYSLRYKKRVVRLFEVEYISPDRYCINLVNAHCQFVLTDGKFNDIDMELLPVAISIMPVERLEDIEYNFSKTLKLK